MSEKADSNLNGALPVVAPGGTISQNANPADPTREQRRLNGHDVFTSVYEDIKRRNELGWAQHAKPLLVNDHTLLEWLEETYAETLDKAVYLKGAILRLKGDAK